MQALRTLPAGVLDVAFHAGGPADGPAVLLMHGFPYDIHAYAEVLPRLTARGCRVIVPYLRGYGPTRFLSNDTPRSGEQAALGADLLALLDALRLDCAVLAGYDWGGRAACVVAALWPERCRGLVSCNSYNIQDIARAMEPDSRRTSTGSGTSTTSTRSAVAQAWRGTAAESRVCCGGCGHRPGASTRPRSSARPPPSITRTSSR